MKNVIDKLCEKKKEIILSLRMFFKVYFFGQAKA